MQQELKRRCVGVSFVAQVRGPPPASGAQKHFRAEREEAARFRLSPPVNAPTINASVWSLAFNKRCGGVSSYYYTLRSEILYPLLCETASCDSHAPRKSFASVTRRGGEAGRINLHSSSGGGSVLQVGEPVPFSTTTRLTSRVVSAIRLRCTPNGMWESRR